MSIIEIISINEPAKWERIVKSFENYDVYYLSNYLEAFRIHGDGEPLLFYYEQENSLRGICAVMKRDIATIRTFKDVLPANTYFDIITPYGYGGFLFEGNTSSSDLRDFDAAYHAFLKKEKFVSEFVRYHPLLDNARIMREISTVVDLGNTVGMDITTPDIIWKNIMRQSRNKIRKAGKYGVEIFHGKDRKLLDEFMPLYNATMDHVNASPYYYFGRSFYDSIHNDLHDNFEMFYAMYQGEIIAMAIMLFANDKMHYHLSGSLFEYRHLAPFNLLLYEAACWGASQGFKTFHLGGGFGSSEDSLYEFKKSFNRHSHSRFSIGKRIVDPETYSLLVEKCSEIRPSFDHNASFFPLYRS